MVLVLVMWQDKNAEGRGQFEVVQEAYQVLMQEAHDAAPHSTQAQPKLHLLMRTQAILYERCAAQLGVYRYPSYASLCALIQKQMLAGKRAHGCCHITCEACCLSIPCLCFCS